MSMKNYFRLLIEGKRRGPDAVLWKPVLGLASVGYGAAVGARRALYQTNICKPKKLPVPVVSIGNLSWGGVGKTPLTRYICRYFLAAKKNPLILTRGYGSDETREFQADLPQAVLGVGKNRSQVAEQILKSRPVDVAIMDDGFQHWQLHRDLDIVVMNVLNPFGNGGVIPRGILREPPAQLKRAHIIVFNDVNLVARKTFEEIRDRVKQLAPKAVLVEAQHEPLYFYWSKSKSRVDAGRLRGKRVTTFSGVGTPRSFQLLVAHLGLKAARNFEFCDHHPFTEKEIRSILEVQESSQSEFVVTTEKDLLRKEDLITQILNPLILKVELKVTFGEPVLHDRLRRLLEPKSNGGTTNRA